MTQRQWISFEDPDEQRTWLFDLTFLESNWHCIYGAGCHGIDEFPDAEAHIGCCSHGAYFSDDDDRERVAATIEQLDPTMWQMSGEAHDLGGAIYQDDEV